MTYRPFDQHHFLSPSAFSTMAIFPVLSRIMPRLVLLAFFLGTIPDQIKGFVLKSESLFKRTHELSMAEHSLTVSYDGRSCEVTVEPGETILAALERSGVARELCLPEMPSDCRRGNCLTCTAQHLSGSKTTSLIRGEDGLSPELSKQVADRGCVLTCSSYIEGEGVELKLGENNQAWNDLYRLRLNEEETQRVAREAMARVIRRSAERNINEWAKETEDIYEKSGDV